MRNVMAIDNGKIIGIPSAASVVSYDNTDSGLTSTNVQDAINEVCDDLSDKADVSSVPTKTSDLTNDSGFITNLVNNLFNYYLKSETYSKAEVDALLQAITTLDIQAVAQLPTTNISTTTIYLVPKQDPQVPDIKDEYINLDGTTSGWELIGNTQIDLSNYVTTSDLTTALADYVTSEQFSKEYFIDTQAVWNSLTVSQKTEYTFAIITDDYDDNPVGNLNALTTTDKSSCVGAINELNSGLIGVTPIKIDGHTPANQGFAGFNTRGLDLTNRYPVAFFIVSSTEQTPYMVAQGGLEGISVGFDPITHNPNLYVMGTSDANWKDTDCFVIYA